MCFWSMKLFLNGEATFTQVMKMHHRVSGRNNRIRRAVVWSRLIAFFCCPTRRFVYVSGQALDGDCDWGRNDCSPLHSIHITFVPQTRVHLCIFRFQYFEGDQRPWWCHGQTVVHFCVQVQVAFIFDASRVELKTTYLGRLWDGDSWLWGQVFSGIILGP